MNELVERLLKPISAEQACGPDLSDDPRFDELQTILRGTPEVEIGSVQKPAQPPDWRELKKKSEAFLAVSKDLRVVVMWCGCALRLDGLPGFRDGLQLIRGLLEQQWAALHPLLDPEDKDPTQRLNILGALTTPRGSGSGWLTFLDYLYAAPVCPRRGAAPVTFEPLLTAQGSGAEGGAPADSAELAQANAAIRAAGPEVVTAHRQTLTELIESVGGIDSFLTTTLGTGGTINFEELQKTLDAMNKALGQFLTDGSAPGEPAAEAEAGGAETASGSAGASITIRGQIRSREDVLRQLESICAYYRQVEPSSPVPVLLRRAQKLVNMNFVQVVQELSFATVDALRPSMGGAVDELASSGAPPPPSS
ncbi:MAG TPA: type VI secretion system protein TssA [Verrucomicrobiae bacterium]|jgi:type VI secretion system protein ImpA|nr:type VI secretion system protein TssA [Verrucomicrobiae bacterium]